ncbi:MAG: hypothetical protein SPL30_06615 [Succinivibrio sp.]|nr:hypothetical protein [Succinivibrio sp.]
MLPSAAAAAGCALLFASGAAFSAAAALALMPKRRAAPSFSQLLEPALLGDDPSVVILKSGAMLSVYELTPPDLDNVSEGERERLRDLLARAVCGLGGQWSVSLDVIRVREITPLTPDYRGPAGGLELERAHLKHLAQRRFFENRFYLTLLRRAGAVRGLKKRSLEPGSRDFAGDEVSFVKEREAAADQFSLFCKARLLGPEKNGRFHETLSFIQSCICGRTRRVALPAKPAELDCLLSQEDFETGFTPKAGARHVACISVDAFPAATAPCLLRALSSLPFECRISMRYILKDQLRSGLIISRRRRLYEQKKRGMLAQIFNVQNSRVDHEAERQAQDADSAADSLNSGEEAFGAYSAAVIAMAENLPDLEDRTRICVRAIEDLGFGARVESVNAAECFLGSLPGDLSHNLRRPMLPHRAACDLFPLCQPWHGERVSPNPGYGRAGPLMLCGTSDGGIMHLNLHEKDLGNTLVSGPPGTGKSVLLNAIIHALLRYKGMRVRAFERGFSLLALCRSLGGSHTLLDGSVRLCPLQRLENDEDLSRARAFIIALCDRAGQRCEGADEAALTDALRLLSKHPAACRTLTDLHMLCRSESVRSALIPYLSGSGSGILDGDSDAQISGPLSVFECGDLFERPQECIPVLRHLLSRILREAEQDSAPGAIVLDEAWIMLRDPTFSGELLTWLKTLRKHNTAVIMATQTLSDLEFSGRTEALLDCIKTRIYLPNPDAREGLMRPRYEMAGLNSEQIEAIAFGAPRRDLFLQKGGHFSRFELLLSKAELDVFSLSGAKALEHCKEDSHEKR